jgi:hypothetical protein
VSRSSLHWRPDGCSTAFIRSTVILFSNYRPVALWDALRPLLRGFLQSTRYQSVFLGYLFDIFLSLHLVHISREGSCYDCIRVPPLRRPSKIPPLTRRLRLTDAIWRFIRKQNTLCIFPFDQNLVPPSPPPVTQLAACTDLFDSNRCVRMVAVKTMFRPE